MLIIGIIGCLLTIYTIARTIVVNEPLKSHIDNTVAEANTYLITLMDAKPTVILNDLSKVTLKIATYSIFLIVVIVLVIPKDFVAKVSLFFFAAFVISSLSHISIEWNLKHIKSLNRLFGNIYAAILIFAPSLVYLGDILFKVNYYNPIFHELIHIIGVSNFLLVQLVWAISSFVLIYILFWIVSIPIFFSLYFTVLTFAILIKYLNKYINGNILEVLIYVLLLFVTCFEMMK